MFSIATLFLVVTLKTSEPGFGWIEKLLAKKELVLADGLSTEKVSQ
jgi:hypothetical protein